jgi:hypothetical protein
LVEPIISQSFIASDGLFVLKLESVTMVTRCQINFRQKRYAEDPVVHYFSLVAIRSDRGEGVCFHFLRR